MAERQVLRMGHPELMRVAEPITAFGTDYLNALVQDLWDTMRAYGGIGLAATQIGVAHRVVVFGLDDPTDETGRPVVPRTTLVNPIIEPLESQMTDGWEACLSVPGMRGVVPRYERIRYSGVDPNGLPIRREAQGFHARVIQHECDHLDGVLYPMRMADLATLGFDEELRLGKSHVADEVDCT